MIIYLEASSWFFVQMVVCLSLNFYFIVVPELNIPNHKVLRCGCKCHGGTIKDNTKPTLNPTASAEDPSQEIKRLRAEILELRNEQQATTEVPKWFRKWNNQQATTEEAPKWFRR